MDVTEHTHIVPSVSGRRGINYRTRVYESYSDVIVDIKREGKLRIISYMKSVKRVFPDDILYRKYLLFTIPIQS